VANTEVARLSPANPPRHTPAHAGPGRANPPLANLAAGPSLPASASVTVDVVDVSIAEFLANRRSLPHLFDLEAGHSAFQPGAAESPGAPIYATIRTKGERHTDVRLLIDDGEQYTGLAKALARNLGCDVYLTPHGACMRYVRESSSLAGTSWDAMAVDRQTGEPVPWLVVRPAALPADVPTWFTTIRGRLRQSSGLVSVTLPDGIAFGTMTTFRDMTYLAATMRGSTSRITTVAVNADLGRFEISRFDDTGSLLTGVEFATLVSASLDVIHPDVQIALTWPTDVAACAALDTELMRLADALNRTVWVPQPQGAAFVLPGCGEFAAVDEVGGPSAWRPYPSRMAGEFTPRYGTDLDGRLVPRGELLTAAFPGVNLISVPAHQLENLRRWYASVPPSPGLFTVDLAVLADGRLGVLINSGRPVAVAPRELRALLRSAGWQGEDLLLLTQPPPECWDAVLRHVQHLADQLSVDVWMAEAGADVWAQADGRLAAVSPGGGRGWRVVTYARPTDLTGPDEQVTLPRALVNVSGAGPHPTRPPSAIAHTSTELAIPDRRPQAQPMAGPQANGPQPAAPTPEGDLVEPAGMTLARVLGKGAPHAVTWLPAAPVVNRRAMDLYLWTPLPADEIEAWGLPSADLFLLAGQDPLRISDQRRVGYLLRLHTPAEAAIELDEHLRDAPVDVRHRLITSGATHLLPLAWLSDLRVTGRFDLDQRGGIATRTDIEAGELAIRFEGAGHGVPGLPNDVVHWPDKSSRAAASPAYLMLPDSDTAAARAVHRGYVPLSRTKPVLLDGYRLLEVKVRKQRAVDVPATLDSLNGLPVVGRMHDFVGLDLLLPEDDLPRAIVSKVWRYGPTGKVVVDKLTSATLAEVLDPTAHPVEELAA
jgi:hypothetical protein